MFFLSFFHFLVYGYITRSTSVDISIKGSFLETSLIEESALFVADSNSDAYFSYIKNVKKYNVIEDVKNITKYSFDFLSDELIKLLQLSLNCRAYSPKIELYRDILRKNNIDVNEPVIYYADKYIYDVSELKQLILNKTKSRPVLFNFEPRSGSCLNTLIFYSPISHENFSYFLEVFHELEDYVSFVYRPSGQMSSERVKLNCFGMEMRPFDYLMNETNTNDKTQNITDNFIDIDPKFLAAKITQYIRTTKNPLKSLLNVCQNFPLYSKKISKTIVGNIFREKVLSKPSRMIAGRSSIFVNNRNIKDPSVYSLIETSLEELRLVEMLREFFFLSEESINETLSVDTNIELSYDVIVNYQRGRNFIYNMNDLEEGRVYKNWTRDFLSFSRNPNIYIAKNIYNALFFIDPVSKSDMKMLLEVDEMIKKGFPVRFSYILIQKNQSKLAKNIYAAWSYLRTKFTHKDAHQFLLETSKKIKEASEIKESFFKSSYSEIINSIGSGKNWNKLNYILLNKNTREHTYLKMLKKFLRELGINKQGCIFNGVFYPGVRRDKKLKEFMIRAIPEIQSKINKKHLNNQTSNTLDEILRSNYTYERFNPLIQHKSMIEFISLLSIPSKAQKDFLEWSKTIKYNTYSRGIKFNTFWVFVGENVSKMRNFKKFIVQTELWTKNMQNNTRIAYFSEMSTSLMVKNSLPPPFICDLFQLRDDEVTIIFNGRILRLKSHMIYEWNKLDYEILLKWEYTRSTEQVIRLFEKGMSVNHNTILDGVDFVDDEYLSQLALYLSFVYGFSIHNKIVRHAINSDLMNEKSPAFIGFPNRESSLKFDFILNPYEHAFQHLCPIIDFLVDSKSFSIRFYANYPTKDINIYPKNFNSLFSFSLNNTSVSFSKFNSSCIYSLMPLVPSSWVIELEHSSFDINSFSPDSSRLKNTVEYLLTSLLVEGNVIDEFYAPVSGLSVCFVNISRKSTQSLSVFERGYFQTRANPGMQKLVLENDVSNMLYSISSQTNHYIYSFNTKHINLMVEHKEGMSKYTPYSPPKSFKKKNDLAINVFIVASGSLYEHLSKIMMLSVLKSTMSRINFILLRNFLSSEYILDMGHFSAKYGCNITYVEYFWPNWLEKQFDKQRIIWGYKILFIDSIMPYDIDKVVYIDADAVVRGNLLNLVNIDLKGCPYGFVPFCSNRKDMKPYRFWESNYWKQKLGSNGKYHISALFVIDLERFRRMDAGYLLRNRYNLISGNPKSLANLDQDLPNDIQDEVPIFSLPSRWLWCCTWCSSKSKNRAEVLDLANDPRRKISKIDMAKTFIEEWDLLDEEIQHIKNKNFIKQYNITEIRFREKTKSKLNNTEL